MSCSWLAEREAATWKGFRSNILEEANTNVVT